MCTLASRLPIQTGLLPYGDTFFLFCQTAAELDVIAPICNSHPKCKGREFMLMQQEKFTLFCISWHYLTVIKDFVA